jgi:hypothetical protein
MAMSEIITKSGMGWLPAVFLQGGKEYGWLPYNDVLKGVAIDWLTLLKGEWVDTGQFRLQPD